MEEQIINVTIKTAGEKCELSDAEIIRWYEEKIAGLFNPEFGTPEIKVELKRIEK
ncbi:MAG: hypothetical protein J6U38_05760 [Clostridia bacterium]|jgi:hypothetical protein|nr:hypothetical protein [Clostridia bacterium]MBO7503856.1 hypothetical protein [Clostridia bacterium]MBO7657907.1 hypothetical protein [Clostridia bacterium]MBP5665652.1 hypothetical protein [Clostridia bacterium]MBP5766924.1 hypothetical protein [Clostridia bacterium]